jgi:hypothetical protein
LTGDRPTGVGQAVKASGAKHTRESPTGKGEEAFASAGGEDEFVPGDFLDGGRGFDEE